MQVRRGTGRVNALDVRDQQKVWVLETLARHIQQDYLKNQNPDRLCSIVDLCTHVK